MRRKYSEKKVNLFMFHMCTETKIKLFCFRVKCIFENEKKKRLKSTYKNLRFFEKWKEKKKGGKQSRYITNNTKIPYKDSHYILIS